MATSNPKSKPVPDPFVFLHVGDLHVADLGHNAEPALAAREARLEANLAAIVDDINAISRKDDVGFVYLPGDLAENACPAEYRTLSRALGRLEVRDLRLIPGDHDRGLGSMAGFHAFHGKLVTAGRLPASEGHRSTIAKPLEGCPPSQSHGKLDQYYFHEDRGDLRCIFLDTVSAGLGRKGWGLDFRLGSGQRDWFTRLLREWRGKPCAVFMHCYPADFHEPDEGDEIAGLIWNEGVRLVEMGHTHYNEVGHDGRTLYATARSVGQNEDGPAGYAVVALDGDAVSWRFRQVQQTRPFVMITSPADRRLATGPLARDANGRVRVRAIVLTDLDLGAPADACTCWCRVDLGNWEEMARIGTSSTYEVDIAWPEGSRSIQVKALDRRFPDFGKDFIDFDTVEPAAAFVAKPFPLKLGSDACAVGSWPIKGVRGDQLGPNKLGRKW